jgi:hypothetical protein
LIHPKEASHIRKLLLDPLRCDPEILRSHAITEAVVEALTQYGLDEFLLLRRRELLDLERSFVMEILGLFYEAQE